MATVIFEGRRRAYSMPWWGERRAGVRYLSLVPIAGSCVWMWWRAP
jgi:hypothetical protein